MTNLKQREIAYQFIGSERYNDLIQNIIPEKMKEHLQETGDNFMYKTDLYFIDNDEINILFNSIFLLDIVRKNEDLPFENKYVEINGLRFERIEDIGVSYSIELLKKP